MIYSFPVPGKVTVPRSELLHTPLHSLERQPERKPLGLFEPALIRPSVIHKKGKTLRAIAQSRSECQSHFGIGAERDSGTLREAQRY